MKLTSFLFQAARLSADAEALASGNPKRIARRIENKIKGRLLARLGFWRLLWQR